MFCSLSQLQFAFACVGVCVLRDLNLLLAEVSQLRSYAAVTPLELAEEQGHDAVVELLKARGARRR